MAACRMSDALHQHVPVLLNEAIAGLMSAPDGIYVDATFGRGSHARAILERLNENGRLFAFDKDPEAVAFAKQYFAADKRFHIFHHSFANMQRSLQEKDVVGQVAGVLFDLGVSSPQLDNPERGFSFMQAGSLDMRMDTSRGESAKEWLARVDEKTLADVLWQFGEEKCSRRIAKAIVMARKEAPITTTLALADIIKRVLPPARKPQDKHPATRSFQAIRIAINQELTELEQGLEQAFNVLGAKGHLAVISFHSLEDRIVKQFIKRYEQGEVLPRGLPIKAQHYYQAKLKALAKPLKPTLEEIQLNSRARSAVLRLAEKQS